MLFERDIELENYLFYYVIGSRPIVGLLIDISKFCFGFSALLCRHLINIFAEFGDQEKIGTVGCVGIDGWIHSS